MQRHRKATARVDLTRGPGRLAAALRINRQLDGLDLFSGGPLWLGVMKNPNSGRTNFAAAEALIGTTVRIGITRWAEKPFRFYERGNPFVSGPKRLLQGSAKSGND